MCVVEMVSEWFPVYLRWFSFGHMHDVSGAFWNCVCVRMGQVGTIQIARLANRPVGQFIASSSLRAVAHRVRIQTAAVVHLKMAGSQDAIRRERFRQRTADGQMNRVDTAALCYGSVGAQFGVG